MKKALILTVSAGMGHNSTAKAIEAGLHEKGIETKTLDVYKYVNSIISETLDKTATIYAKFTPDIYRIIYEYLDKGTAECALHILCLLSTYSPR